MNIENIKLCSRDLWDIFQKVFAAAGQVSDKEQFISSEVHEAFRDKVNAYKGTDIYGYAVGYAHLLMDMVEKELYPGKVMESNYKEVRHMNYADFTEYIRTPNPGDLITILNDKGDNLARIAVRSVIKT